MGCQPRRSCTCTRVRIISVWPGPAIGLWGGCLEALERLQRSTHVGSEQIAGPAAGPVQNRCHPWCCYAGVADALGLEPNDLIKRKVSMRTGCARF
jgi:hypothetical protein